MDIVFWITVVAGVIGIPLAVLQLLEYLKKHRHANRAFRVDAKSWYDQDRVIHHYRPEKSLDSQLRDANSTPASVYVELDLVGTGEDEEVRLAPFLLIRQNKAEPLGPEAVGFEEVGKGDGGVIRWFLIGLGPERPRVFRAPAFSFKDGSVEFSDAPDFFRLAKGERELFMLYVMQVPGYRYEFAVGVPYVFKGEEGVHWVPDTFRVAMIEGTTRVFQWGGLPSDPVSEVHKKMTEFRERTYVSRAISRAERHLRSVRGFEEHWANNTMQRTARRAAADAER